MLKIIKKGDFIGVWDNLTGEYIPDGYPSPPLYSGYGGYDEGNYKVCPECGNTVNLDSEYCYMCGHAFEVENYYKQCPICNRVNSVDAEICCFCYYEFNSDSFKNTVAICWW